MTKKQAAKLGTAKANLTKAMEEGDPKKIVAAVTRVMIADPMLNDVFLYTLALFPLFSKLMKDKRYEPYPDHIIRPIVSAEIRKIKKRVGRPLPKHYREIVVDSFMHALRKPRRKNKAFQEAKKKE